MTVDLPKKNVFPSSFKQRRLPNSNKNKKKSDTLR